MQRLENDVKDKPKRGQQRRQGKKSEPKFCKCGHLIVQHRYTGCTGVIEGSECEDHWVCRCMDVQSIHLAMSDLQKLAKELDIDGS